MRPHHKPSVHTLEEARAALKQHVEAVFDRSLSWHALEEEERPEPEHSALVVGVGTGKSTAARAALPGFIAAAKAAGQPHRVLWLVPTHKLGNETLELMQQLGINAEVMRGREAEIPGSSDPENHITPQKMRKNLDAVEDALSIHADIESSVCDRPGKDKRTGKERPTCPWRTGSDQCAFQRQKGAVARADVVIAAHQAMFYRVPKEVSDGLAMVIVDESPGRRVTFLGCIRMSRHS